MDPVLFGSLRDQPLCFLDLTSDVRLPCRRDAMGFLSPLALWYLPFDLSVSIVGFESQKGATRCIASLVQVLCACSGSYAPS